MPFAAPIFSTVKTLTLAALLGAISAQAITIGAGYSSWNCTGPGSAVSGNVPGKNHVGYNSFISSYLIKSVCSAGDCSSDCTSLAFRPGQCVGDNAHSVAVGCVEL